MTLREQAVALYKELSPQKAKLGKAWRKNVIFEMVTRFGITEAAAAAHFNVAKMREEDCATS